MKVNIAGGSDVGRLRKVNEDRFRIVKRENFAVVCDGMGGHAAGDIASSVAVETIERTFTSTGPVDLSRVSPDLNANILPEFAIRVVQALRLSNRRVSNMTFEDSSKQGMGTTVVAMSFADNMSCVAHVGDSRAYRIRDRKIEQLTVDHSWLEELIREKEISPDEAESFPRKNVITRALGIKNTVEVDLRIDRVRTEDCFLLCSDGLSGILEDQEILEVIENASPDLDRTVSDLIDRANEAGGPDNITVVVMEVIDSGETASARSIRKKIGEESPGVLAAEDDIIGTLF